MLRLIGLLTVLYLLVYNKDRIIKCIDFASYVAKVAYLVSEPILKSMDHFYVNSVAPQVEAAKKIDVMTP